MYWGSRCLKDVKIGHWREISVSGLHYAHMFLLQILSSFPLTLYFLVLFVSSLDSGTQSLHLMYNWQDYSNFEHEMIDLSLHGRWYSNCQNYFKISSYIFPLLFLLNSTAPLQIFFFKYLSVILEGSRHPFLSFFCKFEQAC